MERKTILDYMESVEIAMEKEIAELKAKINALHGELAQVYHDKADLRDEMRQMEQDLIRESNREINDAYQRGYKEGYNDGYNEAAGRQ